MRQEKGNALFLILIAVALFAALSYAVTQSGRGAGTIDREQNLIEAAKVIQYAGVLRSATTRMLLTGTTVDTFQFGTNDVSGDVIPCTSGADCLFAPEGGGVLWDPLPGFKDFGYYNPASGGESVFNVVGVGTAENDVVFWFWIKDTAQARAICTEINKSLGRTIPLAAGQFFSISSEEPGETIGCDNGGGYRFYVTLVER